MTEEELLKRIKLDAADFKVSVEVMTKLHEWFPERDDVHCNEKKYSYNEMNQMVRAAIAQNYKRLIK